MRVGRRRGHCTIAVLADPAAQSYQDVGVEEGTAYQYRVQAYSAATAEAAFVSATTLSPTSLPVEPNPESVHPHYFEPQGVWSLGPPFEIRWLSPEFPEPPEERLVVSYDQGAQYASVSKAEVDWDGTVFTRGSLNFCDVGEVFSGINLETVFARLMDSYVLENFPPMPEKTTSWMPIS
jgi:hypothetical protein